MRGAGEQPTEVVPAMRCGGDVTAFEAMPIGGDTANASDVLVNSMTNATNDDNDGRTSAPATENVRLKMTENGMDF